MKYLLDTNICIYISKRSPAAAFERFKPHRVGDIGLSSVAYGELYYGAVNSGNPEKNLATLYEFVTPLEILPYGAEVAPTYGRIRTALRRAGTPIGPLDMLIAAHALYLDLTLVTNNTKEFARVPDLRIEDWA